MTDLLAIGLVVFLILAMELMLFAKADQEAMQSDDDGAAQSMGDPWCYERKEKCYERKEGDMYHCFHCGKKAVIWDNDYSFEDYCLEGEGVVHELHCTECGATITYYVGDDDADLG